MTQIEASATAPMTGKWKPYPIYKDLGVEWIGEIPEGWNTIPLKRATVFVSRGNSPEYVDESSIRVINQACVYWDGLRLENVKYYREENISNLKGLLRSGDLLINSTGTGTLGRAIYFNQPGTFVADSHVTIVRTLVAKLHVRYLFYLIRSPLYQGYVYAALVSGSTNQVELSREGLLATPIILPSLPEQLAITAFLDLETARINCLIAKKERLIELLQEKRAALISHAVTKGLDSTVPMKDSGVEWLGEIPAHWEVKRIKYVLHQMIDTEHKTAPFYPDDEYLVVRTSNVRNGKLLLDDAKYTNYEGYIEWTQRGKPAAGDILFTREAPAGEACLVPDNILLCIGQRMVLFRVNKKLIDGRYGVWSLYGGIAKEFIRSLSQGSTVVHFNISDIGNIPLLVPPLFEQQVIVKFIDRETAKIDALISRIQEGIEKLREYSSALISAAVTGKIDVREEITLPDDGDV